MFLNLITFILIISTLTVVVYFLSRKHLKFNILFKVVISLFISVGIYFTFIYLFFSLLLNPKQMSFDKKIWVEDKTVQYQMIDDLIELDILIKKNKSEVINLLGNPTKIINEKLWQYEIIGKTWSEFKLISLEIKFESNEVKDVNKQELIMK